MFSLEPDASKCAFAYLLGQLLAWDFTLVDCQVHTEHLERFGAEEWPREVFLGVLRECPRGRDSRWALDARAHSRRGSGLLPPG